MTSALELIRTLTTPDGRQWADTLSADEWIERDILAPILARDDDGMPANPLVWIELARGHAKTSTAAAVAIAEAVTESGTEVIAVAADLDQARLLTDAIAGQCRRNPALGAAFTQTKDEFSVKGRGSRIKVMSSDAPSFYGIGVDCRRLRIIGDELCQWPKRDLYDAVLTTLPKVRDAQFIVITNAGVVGSWAEQARADVEASGYLFAPAGVIASWIRPADLERVRRNVPDIVFRRFFLNEWTSGSGAVFDPGDVDEMAFGWFGEQEPEAGHTYVHGWDIGRRQDATVGITIDTTIKPYQIVRYERLLRAPFAVIAAAIVQRAEMYIGRVFVEVNGIGDPLIESIHGVHIDPSLTTQTSKANALMRLARFIEQHEIKGGSEQLLSELRSYEWADSRITQDSVMALAIACAGIVESEGSTAALIEAFQALEAAAGALRSPGGVLTLQGGPQAMDAIADSSGGNSWHIPEEF